MLTLQKYLQQIANRDCCFDDENFSPCDYSGGNYDDAYSLGCDDGEVSLARELLNKYFSVIKLKEEQSLENSN